MFVFFFNDTATTEIYTLSLHDALPILRRHVAPAGAPRPLLAHIRRGGTPARALLLRRRDPRAVLRARCCVSTPRAGDRKSTRLNSSHSQISYAVFCLKKTKPTEHLAQC